MRTSLFSAAILVTLALGGCSSDGSKKLLEQAVGPAVIQQPIPDFSKQPRIVLVGPAGTVKIADDYDDAIKAFPEPKKAFDVSDLPHQLGEPLKARGWETEAGGFGAILYNNKVALAMYRESNVEESRVQELVEKNRPENKRSTQTMPLDEQGNENIAVGQEVRIWSWELGTQRLVICVIVTKNGRNNVMLSLGDKLIMDQLGMSLDNLRKDQSSATQILRLALPPKA